MTHTRRGLFGLAAGAGVAGVVASSPGMARGGAIDLARIGGVLGERPSEQVAMTVKIDTEAWKRMLEVWKTELGGIVRHLDERDMDAGDWMVEAALIEGEWGIG